MEGKEQKLKLSASQKRYAMATAIVVVSLVVLSTFFILHIYFLTESKCYEDLADETAMAVEELEHNFRSDRIMLRMIANMISQSPDLDSIEVSSYLSTYDVNNLISQIGVLLPDNRLILVTGHNSNAEGIADFAVEAARGEHISTLQPAASKPGGMVVRNYVPVRSNGKTVAMLYSAGKPSNIAQAWIPAIYDDAAEVYVVDRKTGQIIINSTDEKIGNISDMDFEQYASSYSKEYTIGEITGGKKGYSVFGRSGSTEMLYMCYMPFSLEDWEMVVFVPESAVFESVRPVRTGMLIMLVLVLLILFGFAGWMYRDMRRSIEEASKRANVDALTGLQNRNRYEECIRELNLNKEKLTCLYIDANGLHELNNSRGHLAGDQMLRFIADTLKLQFGEEHVYRIGGDEFVVFQTGKSEAELQERLEEFKESLQRNDYHAAVGLCVYGFGMSVDELIKNAETEMYEAKRRYYERIGKVMRV